MFVFYSNWLIYFLTKTIDLHQYYAFFINFKAKQQSIQLTLFSATAALLGSLKMKYVYASDLLFKEKLPHGHSIQNQCGFDLCKTIFSGLHMDQT